MKEIIKALLLEGIEEHTIHRVLDVIEEEYALIVETDINKVVRLYNKRANATDSEWNNYLTTRQEELEGVNNPDKEVRRGLHKSAEQQEMNALAAAHKGAKTNILINKWAKKLGKPVEVANADPEVDSDSNLFVDGKRVSQRNNKEITPELKAHIENMRKKQAKYYSRK